MKYAIALKALSLILVISTSISAYAQEEVKPNSTDVEVINTAELANIKCITPPTGFDTLEGLNGYYHKTIGATMIISLVEGSTVADAEAAFNEEHIARIKSTLISKSTMKLTDGNDMLVFKLTYEFQGETWGRYHAFVGDEKETVWVVISYPGKYSDDVEGVLLQSLRSLKFDQR